MSRASRRLKAAWQRCGGAGAEAALPAPRATLAAQHQQLGCILYAAPRLGRGACSSRVREAGNVMVAAPACHCALLGAGDRGVWAERD